MLRHYFYGIDTIIGVALQAKDKISLVLDEWEKQNNPIEENNHMPEEIK